MTLKKVPKFFRVNRKDSIVLRSENLQNRYYSNILEVQNNKMLFLVDRIGFSVFLFSLFSFHLVTNKTNGFVSGSTNQIFDSELLGIGFDPLSFWTYENFTNNIRKSDIAVMLEVISTRFRRVSTYRTHQESLGIGYSNPETTADWVALSASNLNKKNGKAHLNVYIGLGNFEAPNKTLGMFQNVLKTVRTANANFPGTVPGIILHNYSELDDNFVKVLESVERAKILAGGEVEVGIRLENTQCSLLSGYPMLADKLDFVICYVLTNSSSEEKTEANTAIQNLISLKSGLPSTLKFTGEVDWCTPLEDSSITFLTEAGKLAIKHNIRLDFFEAFDQPRAEFPLLRNCGWWRRIKFLKFLAHEHFVEKMSSKLKQEHADSSVNPTTYFPLRRISPPFQHPNRGTDSFQSTIHALPKLHSFGVGVSVHEATEKNVDQLGFAESEQPNTVSNEVQVSERSNFQKTEDPNTTQIFDQKVVSFNMTNSTLLEGVDQTEIFWEISTEGSEINTTNKTPGNTSYFSNNILWIILAISAITGLLVLILVATFITLRKREAEKDSGEIRELATLSVIKPQIPMALTTASININTSQMLGAGEYGMVFKGTVTGLQGEFAVKVASVGNVKNLLIEMKILSKIGKHSNVVSMIASSTENVLQGEAMLVLDLCEKGNLSEILREIRSTNGSRYQRRKMFGKLMQWSLEITLGMEHISSLNVVHGDLAARNILITNKNVAKITDFGLSRHLYDMETYLKKTKEPMPIRWMALESLKSGIFSTASDVWSYGVTLWEMFSFSVVPYKEIPLTVVDIIQHLENGMRLQKPELATEELFYLMANCWHHEADERSKFHALAEEIKNLQIKSQDYKNINAS